MYVVILDAHVGPDADIRELILLLAQDRVNPLQDVVKVKGITSSVLVEDAVMVDPRKRARSTLPRSQRAEQERGRNVMTVGLQLGNFRANPGQVDGLHPCGQGAVVRQAAIKYRYSDVAVDCVLGRQERGRESRHRCCPFDSWDAT